MVFNHRFFVYVSVICSCLRSQTPSDQELMRTECEFIKTQKHKNHIFADNGFEYLSENHIMQGNRLQGQNFYYVQQQKIQRNTVKNHEHNTKETTPIIGITDNECRG